MFCTSVIVELCSFDASFPNNGEGFTYLNFFLVKVFQKGSYLLAKWMKHCYNVFVTLS